MSGHNKWSTIKHRKAAQDAKRGKLFTRLIREITIAAREGGGDLDSNAQLRTAVTAAKNANMPADNIKRAIQKGTGELPGATYEEVVYEGYGPGGVAVMVDTVTDNRNRTLPEIRHLFSKHGGSLGETNSVAWNFERRGQILVGKDEVTEERLMEVGLEAGVEDYETTDDHYVVYTPWEELDRVREAYEAAGLKVDNAEVAMVPNTTVKLTGKPAEQVLKLVDRLEEHDDVQAVWANFDIDDAELEQMAG